MIKCLIDMDLLNRIITEAIDEVVTEKNDDKKKGIDKKYKTSKKFRNFPNALKREIEKAYKRYKNSYEDDDDRKFDDDDGDEKVTLKKKKVSHGPDKEYDYKEYMEKNKPVSKADASAMADTIDMDRTNISDVAQEIYKDHTKEGAQSQLLKVLNLERRMPVWVYNMLSDMISSGKIATK